VIVRGYVDVLRTGRRASVLSESRDCGINEKVFWKVAEWIQLTEKAGAHFPKHEVLLVLLLSTFA